ncbi:histidine kinase [Geomonas silvestris]|uniref:Sensory/regulatory protein RpfC n=1 Tax=Geomonas silvestris TaxID=2740184 RepID=A0A6V8MKC0_9BACT|nr:response regulator [Geomonas silvestris]GFO60438.1 histidine kinase [Geomonas silvestris]
MSESLRVLLVEDNPGDADLLLFQLPEHGTTRWEVVCVGRLCEALDRVSREYFDIVLLDLGLPDSTGMETFRAMRFQAAKLPIIVLTGNQDERTGLEAIREGAQDYLVKGEVGSELLLRAVRYAIERGRTENALLELNNNLEERIAERTVELTNANEALRVEIAERQRAEDAMRRIKEQWERTFASVPDLIAILDHQHRVLRVNDAMARRLGRTPEDCVGLPCHEVVHGSTLPPESCPHNQSLEDGLSHTGEFHLEQFGGDFLVTTTPLLDENGEHIGSVHIAHDITERKIFEQGLREAKEVAETAARTKSQFLANMSHELRTPMTGVLGMLDLALSGQLNAEQRSYIETAHSSARALVRILNDILDLTKIEMGKLTLEEKPFCMLTCVENTFNLLLPVARNKGLKLEFSVDDAVPGLLVGDQTRLNQVLTNLVGNAVKFTERGRVGLRVSVGARRADGRQEIRFVVSDTGIGIPSSKEDLLFQVFSQVDESHSRRYGGTGLGLAISKEIVERMGGTISFTSVEGEGSTFTCRVPFHEAPRGEGPLVVAASAAAALPTEPAAGKPRLLVAEDDQVIRQVLVAMLERSGYQVVFAENGERAVELWEAEPYQLILMDVQMPRLNGFEATAAIRARERERGGHIPIVAMTAHALKEDETRCLQAGMDAYLSKPIDFRECLQLIGATLKGCSQNL